MKAPIWKPGMFVALLKDSPKYRKGAVALIREVNETENLLIVDFSDGIETATPLDTASRWFRKA